LLKLKPTKSPDPTITGLPPSFAEPDLPLLLLELEEPPDAFTVVVPPAVMFVLPPSFGVSTVGDDSVFPPEFEATAPDPGLLENVKEDFGNVVGDVWIGDDILMLIPGGLVEALLILLFPPRMLLLLFPFELLFNDNDNLYGVRVTPTQPNSENRLIQLNTAVNNKLPFDLNGFILNNGVNVLSYSGGPGSKLGVGKTNIRYADDIGRTGKNNYQYTLNYEKKN